MRMRALRRRLGRAIPQLAGAWSVALFQSGRAVPVGTGQMRMTLLADSLKLAWTQSWRGRADTASGFLGYDPHAGAYYLFGVSTDSPAPMFLVGSDVDGLIRFDPADSPTGVGSRPGVYVASELRIEDHAHLEWRAVDGGWRAEFSRVGEQ